MGARCQARKWFQLSAVSWLIISMVNTWLFPLLFLLIVGWLVGLFGKFFVLWLLIFGWVSWRCNKNLRIMSIACFSIDIRVRPCRSENHQMDFSLLCICMYIYISICWHDLSLIFGAFQDELFTFPLLLAFASITCTANIEKPLLISSLAGWLVLLLLFSTFFFLSFSRRAYEHV